jgi:hypothetical protein|tara:strand:+ start:60 stop:263 length:204 start_codon:yes stop_codon:yes gene_type:complete
MCDPQDGPGHLKHRDICYDDEGSLECCCELRKGLDHRQAELLSRADAHRLVEQNSLNLMAVVMGAIR